MTKTLAAALAAAALFGQLASLAHIVAVQHVACEHGEWVEVDRQAPDALPAANQRAGSALTGTTAVAHGHDHCLLAPLRRNHLGGHASATSSTPVTYRPAVAALANASEPSPPIHVLAFAPKSSPPTA